MRRELLPEVSHSIGRWPCKSEALFEHIGPSTQLRRTGRGAAGPTATLRLAAKMYEEVPKSRGRRCLRPGKFLHLALGRILQIGREPHETQRFHCVPGEVNLPPLQTMPAARLERMVVVVPALPEGQGTNKPVVHGLVPRVPVLEAPDVADRVHGPGDVPDPDNAREESPEHAGQAAEEVKAHDGKHDGMESIGLLHEAVEELRLQVRGVGLVPSHPGALSIEKPAHVRPPEAIERRMHVVLSLRASVVVAMRRDPVDGMALQSQDAAVCEDVLEPLRRGKGTMRELAMVGQGDAEHARDEVADEEASEGLPGEVEGSHGSSEVNGCEEDGIADILGEPPPVEVCLGENVVVPELAVPPAEEFLQAPSQWEDLHITL
mmetsp:Transcript_38827/g.85014  ORF Transcript_38827/g.85014 Transcript_38827/m.85014 type:complete len:377 (-) Transcript_38827:361-1491(-)